MRFSYLNLICLVLLINQCCFAQTPKFEETLIPLHSFSLHSPYIEDNLNNRWWDFGGDTVIEVNKWIRLTPDKQSKLGWLWSRIPFTSNSWIIEFDFRVHGEGSLFGDGFAFWYTSDRAQTGPIFGSRDNFDGLIIAFDTYSNGKHKFSFPHISAAVLDGKTAYDYANDGESQQIAGCSSDFRGKENPKAKIKFVRGGYLEVSLNLMDDDHWETCFRANNVTLPSMGYIGFTALTGDVHDNHEIIRIVTNNIMHPATDFSYTSKSSTSSKESSSGGGFFSWLFTLLIIGGIIGGLYIMYKRQNQTKRF